MNHVFLYNHCLHHKGLDKTMGYIAEICLHSNNLNTDTGFTSSWVSNMLQQSRFVPHSSWARWRTTYFHPQTLPGQTALSMIHYETDDCLVESVLCSLVDYNGQSIMHKNRLCYGNPTYNFMSLIVPFPDDGHRLSTKFQIFTSISKQNIAWKYSIPFSSHEN
jgi:hypothetical protein